MRAAVEMGRRERDRLRDAANGELPGGRAQLLAVELEAIGLEGHLRKLRGVEEILAVQVLVELLDARAHRGGVDRNVGAPGLCRAIERDLAAALVETAPLERIADVAHLVERKRVGQIDRVCHGAGAGGRDETQAARRWMGG